MSLTESLMAYLRERHPRSVRGIEEARAVSPQRFDETAEMFLRWLVAARGNEGIQQAADAFVQFTTDVNLAQVRYEAERRYQYSSFEEVYKDHYSQNEAMSGYLWGIYLTNFLWAHHTEISLLYKDHFLPKVPRNAQIVEIAPGHGGWGVWALHELPEARLSGYDISPTSLDIARSVSAAAGFADRTSYAIRDALDLAQIPEASADAVICSFVVEHLEQPSQLFAGISHLLKPGGIAFVTGALTAGQIDHIWEFKRESELVLMCEDNGLRALITLSGGPRRTLPNAHYLPRSMALIVQKRRNDIF